MGVFKGARAALVVLAKAPVPGKVKTRLCPPTTPDQAARIAAAAFLDTLDAVLTVPDVIPVVALAGDLANAVDSAALTARLRDRHEPRLFDQRLPLRARHEAQKFDHGRRRMLTRDHK